MEHYAGVDVSLKESSVCVVDTKGKVVREIKVASEPEALVRYFDELDFPVSRIGLEAGPLSQWLHAGRVSAGHDIVLLETRHVKAALSAMTVKTDRKDARDRAISGGWDGIDRFTRSRWVLRIPVHFWSGASFCRANFSTLNSAFVGFCAATGSRSMKSAEAASRPASGSWLQSTPCSKW